MFDTGDRKGARPGGSLLSVRAYQPSAGRRGSTAGASAPRRAGNDSAPAGGTIFSSETLKSAAARPNRATREEEPAPRFRSEEPAYAEYRDPDEWRPLIDPARVLSAIWRARYFIAMMTVIGGLLGAAIANSQPAYAAPPPPPGYYAPPPAYVDEPPCHFERERFWDGYGWRMRRIRVCD